jgi:hypothetical protein
MLSDTSGNDPDFSGGQDPDVNWDDFQAALDAETDVIAASGNSNLIADFADLNAAAVNQIPAQVYVTMTMLITDNQKLFTNTDVDQAVNRVANACRRVLGQDGADSPGTVAAMPLPVTSPWN